MNFSDTEIIDALERGALVIFLIDEPKDLDGVSDSWVCVYGNAQTVSGPTMRGVAVAALLDLWQPTQTQ